MELRSLGRRARIIACLLLPASVGYATTYYVDSAQGSDANKGVSERTAWQSLAKVNGTAFQPGDRILFRAGGRWQGQLAPKSSGAEGAPIVFDRYGGGPKPLIDGGGDVEDAVRLYNVQQIELRNLAVTNHGGEPGVRRGVHVFADNFGTAHHIVIAGLYVHDVNGLNPRRERDTGGIIFDTNGDRTPSRFDGLTIERNIIWKVDREGITGHSHQWQRTSWNPSLHVVIRDNLVDDIGGDGIMIWTTAGALVEHNIARHSNRRASVYTTPIWPGVPAPSYNIAIWPWSADDALFQLNEAGFKIGRAHV
jgi:hypothetical protein